MLKKDTGICIRKVDYSETSQILTFFTRDNGKVEAIAKGSKRKKSAFEGAIEIFSFGEMVFTEPAVERLATLTEFGRRLKFAGLRKNLFALNAGLFAAELLNSFTVIYDAHPELFDAFAQFLEDCGTAEDESAVLRFLIVFQLALLEQTGSRPVLGWCVNCKADFSEKWGQVFFSNNENGFICMDCEGGFPDRTRISKDAARCLSDLGRLGMSGLETLREIEKVLVNHFTSLIGKSPRMAKYFSAG